MQTKYKIAFMLFFCLFFLMVAKAMFAFRNEPEGFRGIKWEARSHGIQGLKLVETKETGNGEHLDIYVRKGDRLSFGQVELKKIRYVFYKNRFFLVHLVAFSHKANKSLKQELVDRFGEPSDSSSKRDLLYWDGKETSVYLKYDVLPKRSVLSFYYQPIGESLQSKP